MNTIRKSIIVGLTVLGMGSASVGAFAQTAPADSGRPQLTQEQRAAKMAERKAKREERMAKRAERMEKRQAALHDALKLNSAQEGAWRDFIAATRHEPRAGRMDHAAFRSMTTPQRMDAHLAMAKERLAKMEARVAATKAFYAQLSPEQQKTFDNMRQRHGKRHHGGMMHRGHHG